MQNVAQFDVAVRGSGQAKKRSKGVAALALAGLMAGGVASGILVQQVGYYQEESSRAKMAEASNYATAEELLRNYAISKGSFPCPAATPGGASDCKVQNSGWLPVETLVGESAGVAALNNIHYTPATWITAAAASSVPNQVRGTVLDVCRAGVNTEKNATAKAYTIQMSVPGSDEKVVTVGETASSLGCDQLLKAVADVERQSQASLYALSKEKQDAKAYLSGQKEAVETVAVSHTSNVTISSGNALEMGTGLATVAAAATAHGVVVCPEEWGFVLGGIAATPAIAASMLTIIQSVVVNVEINFGEIDSNIDHHECGACGQLPPGIEEMLKTA